MPEVVVLNHNSSDSWSFNRARAFSGSDSPDDCPVKAAAVSADPASAPGCWSVTLK
jgi:hypothetical protein